MLREETGDPLHLLGHSFGGLVTRAAVLAEPGMFTSFTLLGSGPSRLTGRRAELLDHLGPLLDAGGVQLVHETLEQVAMTDPKAQAVPAPTREFYTRRFLRNSEAGLRGMADAMLSEPDRVAELGGHGRARAGRARRGRRRLAAARAGRQALAARCPARSHQQLAPFPRHREPAADVGGAPRLLGGAPRPSRDRAAVRLDGRGGPARLLRPRQCHLAGALRPDLLRRRAPRPLAAGPAPGRDGRRRTVLRRLPRGAVATAPPDRLPTWTR